MSTSPSRTRARQVPQTPPLQANGRSVRVAWAASRIDWPRGIGGGGARAVEDHGDLAGLALDDGVGAVQLRRGLVDVEQLEVDPVLGDAEVGQHLAGGLDHRERPAQPDVVDVLDRHQHGRAAGAAGRRRSGRRTARRRGVRGTARGRAASAAPYRFFRSASSSANITDAAGAVAVESVTSASGLASTVVAIDSIGVMPEPAAMHRCRPPGRRGRRGSCREGVCTSTSVPGVTSWTSQCENRPSGISRTPIRGRSPTAAQIE